MPDSEWDESTTRPVARMGPATESGGGDEWDEGTTRSFAPQERTSLGQAALKGVQDIPTFGYGDEIGGGIQGALQGYANLLPQGSLRWLGIENYRGGETDPLDTYRHARDENRVESAQAAEDQPLAYYGAGLAASLPASVLTPEVAAFKGAGVGARLGNAAVNGVLQGAAAGLGGSTADLTRGDLLPALYDTAIGGVEGGALGTALQGGGEAFNGAKNWMRQQAELRAAKAGGSTLKLQRQEIAKSRALGLDPLAEERARGRELLDSGAVRFGDRVGDVAERLQGLQNAAGQDIGAARSQLDDILAAKPQSVPLSDLDALQAKSFDPGRLAESRAKLAAGETPPPIKVWRDADGEMTMMDGNNRLTAAREAGSPSIPVSYIPAGGYHVPSGAKIADRIREELLAPLAGRPGMADAAHYLEDLAQKFEDPEQAALTFGKLAENKRDFGGVFDRNASDGVNRAKKAVYGILKDEETKAAQSLNPELGAKLSADNRRFELLTRAKQAAEDNAARAQNNRVFSLSDQLAGLGGMAVGGPAGYGAAIGAKQVMGFANKTLRERGAASVAVTLDHLSRANPDVALKYVQPLLQAAQRGPQAVAALDYVLAQKDEHWRSARASPEGAMAAAP